MKSDAIRSSFLDYFREQGHRILPSAPLVPQGDPTLLFTNAGMVQFKNQFLGLEAPASPRVATAQKCLRVSGKHNDLENVGPSPRHHTFFEMLGNFSFGDYFKDEAIRFGWDLVTRVWGLPAEHLAATVFEEDDEAAALWAKISSLPAERILRAGAKDNFWAMGETGPCGPCSEIFVDTRPREPEVAWEEGTESGRYIEIWNLVFMQFDRDESGTMRPLPRPSIDTGAGLERVAAVLQGVPSNYDTDLFQPLIRAAAALAGARYGDDADKDVALRVIADHLRAVTFLLADGVIPANEGRGYVLRRILRRAVRHGLGLGFEEPFLHRLVPVVGEVLGGPYRELAATEAASAATVRAEEEKFLATLAGGARQVQVAVEAARAQGLSTLPGAVVFRLYDTHGLPLEVIEEIAEEERLGVDREGFERELESQRTRSRAAGEAGQAKSAALRRAAGAGEPLPPTEFVGYDRLELAETPVVRLAAWRRDGAVAADSLSAGEHGVVALTPTVFYAEAGGQVGDRGTLTWEGGRARVVDTQKDATGVHFLEVEVEEEEGSLAAGADVRQSVAADRRRAAERHHTATHLLHAALRATLGDSVRQAGSLVAPDRLRFDFTFARPLEPREIEAIEDLVHDWVLRAVPTRIEWQGRDEALAAGAMALFGEKYGDRVRTVAIPGFSLELCGGCHVANTGTIGPIVITGERGVASGVRRIEALAGDEAHRWLRRGRHLLAAGEAALDVPAERLPQEIESLRRRLRETEKELADLRLQLVTGPDATTEEAIDVDGVKVVAREVPPAPMGDLRNMADTVRSRLGSGVAVLATRDDGKVHVVVAVSRDLQDRLHAGRLAQALAEHVGGKGGGRPDFAQAGGRDPENLPTALAAVPVLIRAQLAC
ncbi:MAG: alanine--tRNA ligase [Thermoanaerobaculia bacterium]